MPLGFRFSGVASGIKPSRRDVALIASDVPCAAAACVTANKAKAAPCLDLERRVPLSGVRAVVVNSGNANALTGDEGLRDVQVIHDAIAAALSVEPSAVLSGSTGVIGLRLPANKIVAAAPKLVAELSASPEAAAEAIMTTDTRIKMASRTLVFEGREVTIGALAKGSGMIAPQLATVIAVIVTDCALSPELLQSALREAVAPSFDCLNLDGEMSTNDAVLALANGQAGHAPLCEGSVELAAFKAALTVLCQELAEDIAADGEGATKTLEVSVKGAPSEAVARDLAKAVVGSPLVKTAFFGADPNWGRVLATLGARAATQGHAIDPYRAHVSIQGLKVFAAGPAPHEASALRTRMRAPYVQVEIALGAGEGSATAWGCDLSYDYVKINADYTSLIVQKEGGGVAKDDRLANYTPSFKVSLLVEALAYITRFSGTRCVIKYGGAAMVKDTLKQSFCHDMNLLRSVGLRPIVVHGGGPEITRTLEKLGRKSEFVDGMRVTDAADLKVVEMVLSGSINSELVTLLNREGGHAVGVSGKDGALLKARKLSAQDGRDLGQVGEVTAVNTAFLDMLLQQGYVPVISPIGIGDDGQSYNINADQVASEVAVAIGASKLIYLTDVPGIMEDDALVTELNAKELAARLEGGSVSGGMKAKVRAILRALDRGVQRVHVIDGRTPHSVIAELFTDRGVGTLVTG
jgi:acetylglutamate kinase